MRPSPIGVSTGQCQACKQKSAGFGHRARSSRILSREFRRDCNRLRGCCWRGFCRQWHSRGQSNGWDFRWYGRLHRCRAAPPQAVRLRQRGGLGRKRICDTAIRAKQHRAKPRACAMRATESGRSGGFRHGLQIQSVALLPTSACPGSFQVKHGGVWLGLGELGPDARDILPLFGAEDGNRQGAAQVFIARNHGRI